MTLSAPGGSRPCDGLVHDLAGYLAELAMLVLAQCAQPLESLMLGAAASTHQDPDSPVDDAAEFKGRLQLVSQPLGLCENVGVLHGDRGSAKIWPSSAARSSKAFLTFIAPTTPSGVINGNDTTLCTPSRAIRPPKRGQRESPPSEPDRTVRPSRAALIQGPWPISLNVVDLGDKRGGRTQVSALSCSSSVRPAPSAPGMACTAYVATWVSMASSGSRYDANRDKPARLSRRSSSSA